MEAVYVIDSDLDIRVPSIGLLSEDSTDITTLKNNKNVFKNQEWKCNCVSFYKRDLL
jgi:hypothetical protein